MLCALADYIYQGKRVSKIAKQTNAISWGRSIGQMKHLRFITNGPRVKISAFTNFSEKEMKSMSLSLFESSV